MSFLLLLVDVEGKLRVALDLGAVTQHSEEFWSHVHYLLRLGIKEVMYISRGPTVGLADRFVSQGLSNLETGKSGPREKLNWRETPKILCMEGAS